MSPILTAAGAGFLENLGIVLLEVNEKVNGVVCGLPMLVLLFGIGLCMSLRTSFFQVTRFGHWWRCTIVALFKNRAVTQREDPAAISQFQALATALSATAGTGNIMGVATAIAAGGPGAIFWMWVFAFFGMMTKFSETVLAIYYRHRDQSGRWVGGTMFYIEKGLKARWLAVLFAVFCLIASFGIGNLAQVNSISVSMRGAFGIPPAVTGAVLALLAALVMLGGLQRVAAVSEKLVPFVTLLYFAGAILVVGANITQVPAALQAIFVDAFNRGSAEAGLLGHIITRAVRYGMARGAFSNEAGMGSSCLVHAAADVKEPVEQGMWAIFEVFADTIVVCTLTALAILTTGAHQAPGLENTHFAAYAFESVLGKPGVYIITVSILLFAFSTLLGWSVYGARAIQYLGGKQLVPVYKGLFILVTFLGAVSGAQLVWDLSDTFNGLMALPNLIALFGLSGTVSKILRNYKARVFDGKKLEPMLSYKQEISKK